ncbi:putative MATE family efflux protein [Breznakia blatticola]|uniref:Multidrug export protein MepA n=1 Tax=Breznakia blatticola TaxID=1754012 RepID=A0A4V3G7V9_9FIRM|nr:MATE family efflux transporter [Breznakia blatticola]TDW20574.1 putative MATE family efflux protein [Breznakia blatticola]
MNTNDYMTTEKTSVLMRKYTIPCIISLLVGALYNIVDQIFIANADYLGSFGNAANTVVYPLTVIALAIAVMIGDGACAFISIRLGKKEHKPASVSVGNAIVLSLITSVALMAVYLVFQQDIVRMFGGAINEQTFELSNEYFFFITIGLPFYMLGQTLNPIIRADGNPKYAMFATLSGALCNVILDPIFIFVFRWGMMGAALATVIGQILSFALSVIYLFKLQRLELRKSYFILKLQYVKSILELGFCSFISQLSIVVSIAAINNMIQTYGALDTIFSQEMYAHIPMAIVGIVMKFFGIVVSIVIGLAAGSIPLVGYNLGANRKDRVKEMFVSLMKIEAIVGAIGLLVVELFPNTLLNIFGAQSESVYYTAFGVKTFRIYLSMLIFASVNKGMFIFLQSLGKSLMSTVLSLIREIVLGVGLVMILPRFFGLDGILYSMPIADVITFILVAFMIAHTYQSLSEKSSLQVEAATS